MGINVTITADSAEELRGLLNGFKELVSEGAITGASVTASTPTADTTAKRPRKPADTTAAPETKPKEPEQQKFGITLADVQAKLRGLSKAGHGAAVKALLDEFGVPNLSALPEDRLEDISAAADLI